MQHFQRQLGQHHSSKDQRTAKGFPRGKALAEQQPAAQRTKDIKNAIRWNIRQLEHDTVGADTIARSLAISMLRLNKIAPTADPSGDHAMQQLISDGILGKPERRGSVQMFDRAELLTSLKAWVGVL